MDLVEFSAIHNHFSPLCGVRLSSIRVMSCLTRLINGRTFVGALGQAFTSDRFGRRGSILIWSAIFTVGTAIQTATVHSVVQITIGRFIAGLGVGALSGMSLHLHVALTAAHLYVAIVPLYNGETAPKAMRGMLLVLYQLQIIIG